MHRTRVNPRKILITGSLCVAATMFIWLKLRVVSSLPKTAYAEPREIGPAADDKSLPMKD